MMIVLLASAMTVAMLIATVVGLVGDLKTEPQAERIRPPFNPYRPSGRNRRN